MVQLLKSRRGHDMYFSQKQHEEIAVEVRELLNKGYVEPEKSLNIKAIFDKYRDYGCGVHEEASQQVCDVPPEKETGSKG